MRVTELSLREQPRNAYLYRLMSLFTVISCNKNNACMKMHPLVSCMCYVMIFFSMESGENSHSNDCPTLTTASGSQVALQQETCSTV